ncbi:MAG: hypothetical protein L3J78_03750 [Thermoplasmata archaeon]|nr:hypothetical protein [Thermoplasmata archaeon]
MAKSPRPRVLAAGFGVVFLLVAYFSWTFAQGLSTAWYPSDISRWIYTTYMLVSAIFLVGLGGLGLSIRRSFSRQIREIETGSGRIGDERPAESLPPPLPDTMDTKDHVDRDIDELLESLSEVEATAVREANALDIGDSGQSYGGAASPSAAAKREQLMRRRRLLGRYLLGPGIVVAFVLGLSGFMLPGTGGFTDANFKLNTALILGIGYSWVAVGWFVALTIYALVSATEGKRGR